MEIHNLKVLIGGAAAAIDFLSVIPYIIGILRGTTKPHAFSWLIWAASMSIGFAAQVAGGGGPGTWVLAMGVTSTFVVFVLSLKYGERRGTRSDWVFFIAALFAIPLWMATDDPTWSVILITAIDLFGYGPTFRKSWTHPHQEVLIMWELGGLKFALGILALTNYSLTTYLYPAAIAAANVALVIVLIVRRAQAAG